MYLVCMYLSLKLSIDLYTVIPDPEKEEQVTIGHYPTADYLGKHSTLNTIQEELSSLHYFYV